MSNGGGVSVGAYRRKIVDTFGATGAPGQVAGRPTIYFVNIGAGKADEYLLLFEQAALPVPGDIPKMAVGPLALKGQRNFYEFGIDGISFSTLFFGISTTLATFTPTAVPLLYFITFGRANQP